MEEIELSVINEISNKVSEFGAKIRAGTANEDEFITMHEIEREWSQLKIKTDKLYSDMVGRIIDSIDERGIIRKKKENIETKG